MPNLFIFVLRRVSCGATHHSGASPKFQFVVSGVATHPSISIFFIFRILLLPEILFSDFKISTIH